MGQGGCPLGSHPLPLRKVTSSSSTAGSSSPAGVSQWPDSGSLGAHSVTYVLLPGRGPPLAASVGHPQGPLGPCEIGVRSSHLGGGY